MTHAATDASPIDTDLDHGDRETQHIKLACQACQRKKIKCDRTFPCGQCHRSGLHCVPSTRKPRTRHAGKRAVDSELRARISKLEGLVQSLSGEAGHSSSGSPSESPHRERQASTDAASPTASKFVASSFWTSLTSEVQALRDVLDDEQHASDDESMPSASKQLDGLPVGTQLVPPPEVPCEYGSPTLDYDLILCPPGVVYIMPGALNEPSPSMAADLYTIFLDNVDPLFKVFHQPSLKRLLFNGESYLGLPAEAPGNSALKASIWFTALITLTDVECESRYGIPRTQLLNQYRRLVDLRLAQADLLNTTDLATLQALVTYMAAFRIIDTSRRIWTLLGLVVRIARGMNLHLDNPSESPFRAQIVARLWYQITVVDAYCSLDRGTEPVVPLNSFTRSRPALVNDEDFDVESTVITPRVDQLTDMSFARLAQEGAVLVMRFNSPEDRPSGDTWQHRLDLTEEFKVAMQEKVLQYCDPKIQFHRLILLVGHSMGASMMLRAIRPMQRHVSSVPPPVDSPYVLQLAVDNLKTAEDLFEDDALRKWRWMVWVQWHAIAVTLAGLCSIRDTPLANQAWELVERSKDRYSTYVADTKHGMLWKPIERLYRKAVAFRDSGMQITPPSQRDSERGGSPRSDANPAMNHNGIISPFGLTNTVPISSVNPTAPGSGRSDSFQQMYQSALDASTAQMSGIGTYDMNGISLDGMQLSDATQQPSYQQMPYGMQGLSGVPVTQPGPADNSWLDWEKIMRDLDEVQMGGLNWLTAPRN